jgi:hypothetical protein
MCSVDISLKLILGHPGSLVSFSKSMGPPMAIYNAKVVVGGEVVWHGDVDLHASRNALIRLAELLGITIEVYWESSVIANEAPAWTTAKPDIFGGEDYLSQYFLRLRNKEEASKRHQIALGILTPRGTEWTWYNYCYYWGPHYIYRLIFSIFHIFIRFPWWSAQLSATSWYQIPYYFFRAFFRELYYYYAAFKSGEITIRGFFDV